MFGIIKKYDNSLKEVQKLREKKEAVQNAIDYLTNQAKLKGLSKQDFSNLLYCYNMLIVAKGSIGNICAIQF